MRSTPWLADPFSRARQIGFGESLQHGLGPEVETERLHAAYQASLPMAYRGQRRG